MRHVDVGTSRRRRRCRNKLCLSTTTCISRSAFPLLRVLRFASHQLWQHLSLGISSVNFFAGGTRFSMPKEILESRLDSFRLEDSCFSRFIYIHEARGQFSILVSRNCLEFMRGAGSRCASSLQRRRVMTKNRGKWIKFVWLFFRIRIFFFLFFFLSWHVRGFRWISTVIPFREI